MSIGSVLAAQLSAGGARILAYDLDPLRTARFRAEHGGEIAVSAGAVMAAPLDVLAPCAGGQMIDERLARSLDCRVVAGAANNPLTGRAVADVLNERGILYVPDFLANCGGLIHVSREWYGKDGAATVAHAEAFEICEYGRRPQKKELASLLPFFGE